MQNLFSQLRQKLSKPILFGLYGAIGCLLAAILLGEPLLAITKLSPSVQQIPQAVALLIDSSGSMSGGKLDEVKPAALGFVQRQDLSKDQLAVISFGETVNTASPLTTDPNTLQSAIASLSDSGGTPMAQGIQAAVAELQSTSLNRNILLFTDGAPDSKILTSIAAQSARNQRINIVAVATGDADTNYLAQLTGNPSLVFYASSGNFDQAFRDAEAAIFSRQLVESGPTGDYGLVYATLRIGGWTALLAIGISLALIVGQNHYLRRRLLTIREGGISTGGSLTAGLIAGAVGQIFFLPIAGISALEAIGRIVGWTILGILVGGGTSFFVPNLKLSRALFGGSVGGALGAIGFLVVAAVFGDLLGRLTGAAILGFCIGLMIAWAEREQLRQQAYLLVHWTPTEQTKILLGEKPVLLGSSADAHVYLRKDQGYPPVTAKIYKEGETVVMQFDQYYAKQKKMTKLRQELGHNARRKLGDVVIEVKTSK